MMSSLSSVSVSVDWFASHRVTEEMKVLGVMLDWCLTFSKHVSLVHDRATTMHYTFDTCWWWTLHRRWCAVWFCPRLTTTVQCSMLLQTTQSTSCSVCRTTQAPRQSDASPLLSTLHWLPVALLTFKVRSTSTPSYLHRLLQETEDVHNLRRQSATSTLSRPFTKTTIWQHAFCCSAPAVWILLPKTVLNSDYVTSFKSRLDSSLLSGFLS